MIKLSGSVGKMGPNKTGDVAVVQAALMNARGGPFWPGPIDGKKTTKFVEAITSFQTAHKVNPANGTIQSFGPTMNRLKSALPMSMSGLGALPDSAVVFVAGAGAREAEREAEETKRKAPFPKLEAEALAKIQKTIGKSAGLCLERVEDSVTKDGCFATELDFQGVKWLDPRSAKPMAPGREPAGVTNYVWSQIGTGTPWQKGSPQDLVFKSKRQFKSLQNLSTGPLSADDKKFLNITTPPTGPVLLACAKGCARLISSGKAATNEGMKEAQIIIEATGNADAQLGKQLDQALKGKGTVQIAPPTRATPRSAPFKDPEVQRIAEVMFEALSQINPISVAQNREYYLEIFRLLLSPPGTPEDVRLRNIMATAAASGELATVPPEDRKRVEGLTLSGEAIAWAHTHGAATPGYDSENFSDTPGDLQYSRSKGWHGGLGTPGGRFLFFNVDQNIEYDLTPMFGSLPT